MFANQPPLSPSEVYSGVTTPQLGARGRLFLAKPEIQEAGITLDDLYQTVRDQYESTGLQAKRFDLLAKIFTDFARSYDLAPDDFAAALNISVAEANALLAGPDARTVQLQQLWAQTVSVSQSTMLRNALQVAAKALFNNMREIGTSAAELAAANGITVAAVNEFLDIAKHYVFDDFTLPSDWYGYTPAQKAAWFNQNNVTPTQLRAAGVPDEDMAYLRQAGYTIQDAASAAPVDSVTASAAFGAHYVSGDVILLGDSLSTAVGYDVNGEPIGDFSEAIGGQVSNLSRGGMTTREALTGVKPEALAQLDEPSALAGYGETYSGFLQTVHPEKVILRYGAADAALLKSPAETLDNLRKMIDMAIAQNVEPVLVTITPVAKLGEVVHGGLYGDYFDFMPPLVARINSGIRQLASEYQLNLIDVSSVALPAGGLLDGVHPNAQAGAIIANAIEQQLVAQAAPVAAVVDQSRQLVAPAVVTAPAAPSDTTAPVEPEIFYEVPETTPPVETPAPATGVTAVEQYVFGDITLPQGWYQFTPAQKANWFNQNNVTPTRLRAEGVSDEDIKYLRQAGYTIQDATTVAPVSPVAPAAGNLLPLALAAAFVLFGG